LPWRFVAIRIVFHFLGRHVNKTSTGGFAYFKAVSEIDGNNFTLIKYRMIRDFFEEIEYFITNNG